MQCLEWLMRNAIAINAFAVVIIGTITASVALREYKLKAKAEIRQMQSAQAETDVRMTKLFVELMWLANGRAGGQTSETCIEKLFERDVINKDDFEVPERLHEKVLLYCGFGIPVGLGTQLAAIAAVATLAKRYTVLADPAKVGLKHLAGWSHKEVSSAASQALAGLYRGHGQEDSKAV